MAIMPENRSLTASAIDAACQRMADDDAHDAMTLRASGMGNDCDRALWMSHRWAAPRKSVSPRIKRIFDNGHDREARIVRYLKAAGLTVEDRDPSKGEQWRVSLVGGVLLGSADGIVTGVPEAPVTRHLLEIKTMNKKRWQEWRRKGVKDSNPGYWVQMQIYMRGLDLKRALLVCECQDTKEIETERVCYDELAAAAIEARAMRVASATTGPDRIGKPDAWPCNLCDWHDVCHGLVMPRRNCRTCIAVKPDGTSWHCQRHGYTVDIDRAAVGCALHLYEPSLIAGEQVDADDKANAVTYRMPDGSTWIDGMVAS